MKGKFRIKELSKAEMLLQFPLLKQLSASAKENDFRRMLPKMLKYGYRMVGVYNGKKCIGISGFWIGIKLYSDKYLEPDNVVIDKNYRSKGVGKKLFIWLEKEAKRNGCKIIMLDAYVENFSGHKFYWREGYTARGFHFLKKL